MVLGPCPFLRLVGVGAGSDARFLRTGRLMRAQLGQRVLRPAALTGRAVRRRRALGLLLAKLARRQSKAMAEGPAEMRGVAKAIAIGDLRDRTMRLGRIGQIGPGSLQPPLAYVMGEIVADRLEQFLQIALGNALGLRDARRHQFGIVEPALDGLADPVQHRGLRRARSGIRGRAPPADARASAGDRRAIARPNSIRHRLSVSSVRAVASSRRENTSARPLGGTTRGSPNRGLPEMRPCSASDVTDSTIARMSRWNTTLQSPLRGSSRRWPTGTMRWPPRSAAPCRPRPAISAIGRSVDRLAATARRSAMPADMRVSATPAALRCEAVACPS